MKHELRAIFRVLMWFMIAVALLSVLSRIIFELVARTGADNRISKIFLTTITSLFLYGSILALELAGTLMCVVRYFKSLFTGEGYMTFSLPVTPGKLLVAKFLSALIVTVACSAEVILCFLVALPQSAIGGIWEGLTSLLPEIVQFYSEQPLLASEETLLFLVSIPSGIIYLFLVASIGQLFNKHRVGLTILLYYGSSFVIGILFSLLLVPFVALAETSLHLIFWLTIVLVTAFDVGGFFLIRYILNRKVNLVV